MEKKHLYIVIGVLVLILIIIIIAFVTLLLVLTQTDYCFINFNEDFKKYAPLILNKNADSFILPTNKSGILLSRSETLQLWCTGENNSFHTEKDELDLSNLTTVDVTCTLNKLFTLNTKYHMNVPVLFEQLKCKDYPEPVAKESERKCTGGNFKEVDIGFEENNKFIALFTTCFDNTKKNSLYSKFKMPAEISYRHSSDRPETFRIDKFYNDIDVDKIYTADRQKKHFSVILGPNEYGKYFDLKNKIFNRGHLTANADFIYNAQQRATFYYINVAPQWKNFNGGNWNNLEINLRNYAKKFRYPLEIYTGVYGQAKLLNENNTYQNLYLQSYKNTEILAVPEIFWKLVYDPFSDKAIVFIGNNNPYESQINTLCYDICDKIGWLQIKDRKDKELGYMYCCDYVEFKKVVDYIPVLRVVGRLS